VKTLVDIRPFTGRHHKIMIEIEGLQRYCPLYKVGSEMWIVGNDHLSFGTDIEFTRVVGKKLAKKLARFDSHCILTAEAKSLGLAYETAKNLGHPNFSTARKTIKPYNNKHLSTEIRSITTGENEMLYLDVFNITQIKGKKIILLDDVISTCSTMIGLLDLAKKAGAEVSCIAAVWLEGPWPYERFGKEFKKGRLVYLDILPIYATGETYRELYEKKLSIEK